MDRIYRLPCGCSFPIDGSLPEIYGRPSLIYPDDPTRLPDCGLVWEMLAAGHTKGVFQLESPLGKQWCKKLRPESIEHMSALGAILRPGCLHGRDENGVSITEHYCRRKNGEEDATCDIEAIKHILEPTYGVMCYQEQMMAISKVVAGFSDIEADDLRKAAGKKSQELMAKVGKNFVDKAATHGVISREKAEALFEMIRKSGRYLFNKCVSFDTKVLRPVASKHHKTRTPFTVEEMYRIRNDLAYAKATEHVALRAKWMQQGNYGKGLSICEDGRIRPNVIQDIQPAGFRPVLKITMENGVSVRVTANHKFPTPFGDRPADELAVGSVLLFCGLYEHTQKNYAYSDTTLDERMRATGHSGPGTHGGDNRWFTNGSFTKFQAFKDATPDVCFDCGKRDCRIETHHVNGDRSNSEPENLLKLCVSCHKKWEYAAGRTKRGEKGYPSMEVRIASIVPDGQCMTYDVTMQAPHHNFAVEGGLMTCNSHSLCYAFIGYHTAHLKAHFPLEFFTSYLYYAKKKADPLREIRQLINEARGMGFEVQPPRFVDLSRDFYTDGRIITFGLADVKGIGENYIGTIRKHAQRVSDVIGVPHSEWSWYEFLVHFSATCRSNVVRRMIEVGGLRTIGPGRKRMLHEHAIWSELTAKEQEHISQMQGVSDLQTAIERLLGMKKGVANKQRRVKVDSLLELLRQPPHSLADTTAWIAKTEEECLGIPITCSRVEGRTDLRANTTCQDFRDGKDRREMIMAVEVQEYREHLIQNGDNRGKPMAFLVIQDTSGVLEDVCMFSEAWAKYGHLINDGATVELKGRRDRNKGSFVVEEAWRV